MMLMLMMMATLLHTYKLISLLIFTIFMCSANRYDSKHSISTNKVKLVQNIIIFSIRIFFAFKASSRDLILIAVCWFHLKMHTVQSIQIGVIWVKSFVFQYNCTFDARFLTSALYMHSTELLVVFFHHLEKQMFQKRFQFLSFFKNRSFF